MKTIRIDALTYGPYGVGRDAGQAVLVPFTAPGDEIEVEPVETKDRYVKGRLSRLIKPSAARQEPPCRYFAQCGGCTWQHLQYEAQLAAKAKNVADALSRIGKLDGFEMLPIIPSPQTYHYRRRIRLQCAGKRVGFHGPFSHELVKVDTCLIADDRVDHHLATAGQWCRAMATTIGQIEIVAGDGDEAVLIGIADGPFLPQDEKACTEFLRVHGELQGLILRGRGWRRSWGNGKVSLQPLDGLSIEAQADSFAQINREANKKLVGELLGWGAFNGADRVLELYCGAGNFTLAVAERVREVVAVEANPLSVAGGKESAAMKGIKNIRWFSLPVSNAVQKLRRKREAFSKVILNPPRSGAKGLERDLPFVGAEKIFYISCDPATLARDLRALNQTGYRLVRVQPFDFFPQTFHVEALAELVRTGAAPR